MGRPKSTDPKVTVPIQLRQSTVDWLAAQSELRPRDGEARSVPKYVADLIEKHEQDVRSAIVPRIYPPRTTRRPDTSASAGKCPHPLTRRIGTTCTSCGQTVSAKA